MNSQARIQELEAKVEALSTLVEQLTPRSVSPATTQQTVETGVDTEATPAPADSRRASRRNLLKLAGAAAAGTAAAIATNALPAAAADPNDIAMGAVSTYAGTEDTTFAYTNATAPTVPGFLFGTSSSTNIFTVRDTTGGLVLGDQSSSGYPAAVGGFTFRTVANGVYGYTANTGYGVVGYATAAAGIGMLARGSKSNIELYSEGSAPTTRTDAHSKGEFVADSSGDVWVCVAAGSPGTWRKLAGTATAGSLHLLAAPKRVYSSRAVDEPVAVGPKTPLSAGTRTIDCTLGASGVPAGATGLVLNVTAIAASANGYLSVSPGASGFSGTSTLNWTANGAIVANGVTVGTGAGATIDITIGGGGTADFIVDVMGYYR